MKTLCFAAGLLGSAAATRAVHVPALSIPNASSDSCYVVSPVYDFSEVKEETLVRLLGSSDRTVTGSAFAALTLRWVAQMEKNPDAKEKEAAAELDPNVKTLLSILGDASEKNDAILAAGALAFTPVDRAHHSVIAKHLLAALTDSKELWVKVHSALALRDLFWARGKAPDEASGKAIDKLLQECTGEKEALYHLLWCLQSMGSDAQPFKATLEKIRDTHSNRNAGLAKQMLDDMGKKRDAAERRKRAFSRFAWN